MNEVFVSYAAVDRARVIPLVHALESEGFRLWWDRHIEYGENFHTAIEQALTAATCVVVVWTRESVRSDWVLNEASDAHKRGRLLPVLLDPIPLPLAFRHLHTADLSNWTGDLREPPFTELRRRVETMVGRRATPAMTARPVVQGRRPAWLWPALGLGACVLGATMLLYTRTPTVPMGPPAPTPGGDPAVARGTLVVPNATETGGRSVLSPDVHTPAAAAGPAGTTSTNPVNLLDTQAGARLLSTNQYQEQYWMRLFQPVPAIAPGILMGGFAILAVRGGEAATFDTLAIFVDEPYAPSGPKDLALFIGSTSEGPFTEAAHIRVPNHHTIGEPFQEFHFTPVQARYVKLQVLSSHGPGASAYVGSIHLYASAANTTKTR